SSHFTPSTRGCRAADGAAPGTSHPSNGRGERRGAVAGWSLDTGRRCVDGASRDISCLLAFERSVDTHTARGFRRVSGDARTWRLVRGCASIRTEAHSYSEAVSPFPICTLRVDGSQISLQ